MLFNLMLIQEHTEPRESHQGSFHVIKVKKNIKSWILLFVLIPFPESSCLLHHPTCEPLRQSRRLQPPSSSWRRPPRTCSPCPPRPPPHHRPRARRCCSSEGHLWQPGGTKYIYCNNIGSFVPTPSATLFRDLVEPLWKICTLQLYSHSQAAWFD